MILKKTSNHRKKTVPLQNWLPPAWFGLHVGFGKAPQLQFSLRLLCCLYKGSWNHTLDPSAHPPQSENCWRRWATVFHRFTPAPNCKLSRHLLDASLYWSSPCSMAKQRSGQVIQGRTVKGREHKPTNSEPLSFYQWHFWCHSPTSPPHLWNVGYLLK